MNIIKKLLPKFVYLSMLAILMLSMAFIGLYLSVGPSLPEVETIRQIRIQTPMSVYSKDGQLINEFGDIRRIPITLDEVPQAFINALLSTEDVRFYEHSGVDLKGVVRAIFKLATTGTKSQGASTITMLVARNYYLTREKRFSRKFTEMFVAWKLESELSKNEILNIFLNKIEFGHRSRGLGAAAQVYYGKKLKELHLAQLASLAGIPKGPSVFNPISRPDKARARRAHVLGRMLSEGHIDQAQFDEANQFPIKTTRHGAKTTVSAPYIAEMVHGEMIRRYGLSIAHSDGLKVYTSINPTLQNYAQEALRTSLLEYDRRHGYRDVEQHYQIDDSITQEQMLDWVNDFPTIGQLIPALVINTHSDSAKILFADGSYGKVLLADSLWARKYIDENHRKFGKLRDIKQIFTPGDIIRVIKTDRMERISVQKSDSPTPDIANSDLKNKNSLELSASNRLPIYLLSQIPDVNGGFVVLNPSNGTVEALVGGFNFIKSQFNMVTQASRQIGSNIKPFIYSAALNKGYTAASLINDSPIIDWDQSAGTFWRPENASESYRGPIRLREALRRSVNTVSVRLIRKIGPAYTKKYLVNVGFPSKNMRPYPSLALGSASFTPMQVATQYAVLANGGYQIKPWFIDRIEDNDGNILFEQQPIQVCEECIEIIAEHKRAAKFQPNIAVNPSTKEIDKKENDTESTHIVALVEKIVPEYPTLPIPIDRVAPRVIDERNRFIINDMLKDVIHRGTAWSTLNRAKSPLLRRNDLAGKTGTTNDSKDAWFSGYNSRYVASAWVGFQQDIKKLGKREFGAKAALPIWRRFMEKALKNEKQYSLPRPDGIVDVKIDLTNGKLASVNTVKATFEVFRIENAPKEYSESKNENIFDQLDQNETSNDSEENDHIEF